MKCSNINFLKNIFNTSKYLAQFVTIHFIEKPKDASRSTRIQTSGLETFAYLVA